MSSITALTISIKGGRPVIVRHAEPDDAEQVLAVLSKVLTEEDFNITTGSEFRFDVEQEREWLEDALEGPGQLVLVAEYEEEIVGMLNFYKSTRVRLAHQGVLSINIAHEWRNQGLGRAMMQTFFAWAETVPDLEKINLEVLGNNERAIALYRSLGFQEEGRQIRQLKLGPDTYIDLVLMGKRLK